MLAFNRYHVLDSMKDYMDRETRFVVMGITAISIVAILLATFVWPGVGGVASFSDAPTLFDEELVQGVYHRVKPGSGGDIHRPEVRRLLCRSNLRLWLPH
jgi:hypothetical protein